MSKISCDVTKDLLASYLDGICSEESKGLVEEHLKECAACRQFVEQTREQDLGKEAAKVDFFKKVKRSINVRSWVAAALALALLTAGHPHIQYQSMKHFFYYIAMPLLMLTGVLAMKDCSQKIRRVKGEWIIPALGVLMIGIILGMQVVAFGYFSGKIPLPRPMNEMGPYIELRNTGTAVLSAVLLIISFVRLKGRRTVFVISQNIAWLGMNLSLSCDTILYYMDEVPATMRVCRNNILVLILEFAVVTALMLIFFHKKDNGEKRKAY